MSKPVNPETIVIKNKYYPKGLREIDIWNYYQKVKPQILKETIGKQIMFAIMTDVNNPVIRRKGKTGTYTLNPKNYDELITGRTATIYSEMAAVERFGIIDIDVDPNEQFRWAKQAAIDTYEFVMDKMPIVRTASIRFTGKTSFHIICDFGRRMKVDSVRFLLKKFLLDSDLSKIYTIDAKRRIGVVNLDLSPNKYRGAYITLNSLSIIGLQCMEVPYQKLMSFNERNATIF